MVVEYLQISVEVTVSEEVYQLGLTFEYRSESANVLGAF